MLKRDLLITLHLHIRLVATVDIKLSVCMQREAEILRKREREEREKRRESSNGRERDSNKGRRRSDVSISTLHSTRGKDGEKERRRSSASRRRSSRHHIDDFAIADDDAPAYFRPSELSIVRERTRRFSSKSTRSDLTGLIIHEEADNPDTRLARLRDRHGLSALAAMNNSSAVLSDSAYDDEGDVDLEEGDSDKLEHDSQQDISENNEVSSIIFEPGRATMLQRKWIDAMSEGKDPVLKQRFEQCVSCSASTDAEVNPML